MTNVVDKPAVSDVRGGKWALSLGILAAPILWGAQLIIGYGLVPVACNLGPKTPLYGLTAIVALLTAVAAMLAWRQWQRASRVRLIEFDTAESSRAFLGSLGVISSVLFFFLILATGVSIVFLNPCPLITMTVP
jgi:hypothetical protein